MLLICIAHKGEAQSFINGLSLGQVENNFFTSTENTKYALLISGEGHLQVLTRLPYFIGKYNVTEIVNFGIAGALTKDLTLNTIYPIRTFYAYSEDAARFHSYTSSYDFKHSETIVDAITAQKRVLDDESSLKLSHYAQIVDLEGWAVGKVAQEFKISFTSYKLISDLAGGETNCFDLKSMAKKFSDTLYHYFCKNLLNSLSINIFKDTDNIVKDTENSFSLPYHASFTQKNIIKSLLNKLDKSDLKELLIDSKIEEVSGSDKVKVNHLITFLQGHLNPVNTLADKKLTMIFSPLVKIGANIVYDKKYEKKSFSIRMDINSQENIHNLYVALEKINYKKIEEVWNGNFDV